VSGVTDPAEDDVLAAVDLQQLAAPTARVLFVNTFLLLDDPDRLVLGQRLGGLVPLAVPIPRSTTSS
jgi:hypothetical protein